MGTETIFTLVITGLLLLFLEVFVPGAILGVIGSVLLLLGIVAGFNRSANLGFCLLLGSLAVGIVGFMLWVKYFPRSRMGKRLFLENDGREWQAYDGQNKELMGKDGTAHSTLRPAGTAVIDGRRVDVVTRGEMVQAGTVVKVIEVEGNRVVVAAKAA